MSGAHSLFRSQLHTAAVLVATAATAGPNPVLHFHPDGLTQVGAGPRPDWVSDSDRIVVPAPTRYTSEGELVELAADRLATASWAHANEHLRWPSFTATQFDTATTALVAAARRQACPSPWVCLRVPDLTEADLHDAQDPGDLIWIPTGDLPRDYPGAYQAAVTRLITALTSREDPVPLRLAA